MPVYTPQPTDTSTPTPIPMSSAVPDGTNTPTPIAGGAVIPNGGNPIVPVAMVDVEQVGYIAATSPPSATNAGSDTPYTFSAQVQRVIILNKTAANVYYAFDVAASLGSLVLVPGAMLVYPKKCTVLHLFTAAAQNINGSTATNIVVLGAN